MAQLFGQNKRLIVQGKIAGKGAEQSGLLRDILKTKGNCGFKDIIEASEKMQAANASSGVSVDNRLVENPSLVKLEAERQRIAGIIQVVFAAVQAGRSVKAAFQGMNEGKSLFIHIPTEGRKFNQLTKRGWTRESIHSTVNKPYTTREAINKASGNNATAYFNKDGSYIVRDNVTGDLVQMSDKFDPGWLPDPTIKNPYTPK